MRAMLLAIAAMLLVRVAARADDVVSAGPDAVHLTLYHQDGLATEDLIRPNDTGWLRDSGLAFITEERTVDLPAGPSTIRFRGVASTMVPQSADVTGLPQAIVERDFDYDLLSPGSLLAKSIGQTVHLVRTNPKTGVETEQDAIVRSGPSGALLEIDGKLEALQCSGLPEKVLFDAVPEGLTDTPTLSLHTVASEAGRYTVKLSYVATGLNWNADYVGRIAEDGKTLDLSGWLTLANFGSTSFARVPLDVVAGRVNTTGDDAPVDANAAAFASNCWRTNIQWGTYSALQRRMMGDSGPQYIQTVPIAITAVSNDIQTVVVTAEKRTSIEARALGDYKLYPLPEPTTMAAQQSKQVQFVDKQSVPFDRLYSYAFDALDGAEATDAARILVRLDNSKAKGLGLPLPAGLVSIQAPDTNGAPIFQGQGSVDDTPEGLPIDIYVGQAAEVQVEHSISKSETVGSGNTKSEHDTIDIAIANAKSVPIQFEYYDFASARGAKIVAETQGHTIKKNVAMWGFTVPPGGHATLQYTIATPVE